jgi:hypothetical protein
MHDALQIQSIASASNEATPPFGLYVVAKKVQFTGDMADIEAEMDRKRKAREAERAKIYKCPCGNFLRKREEGALCNACFGKQVGEKRAREE